MAKKGLAYYFMINVPFIMLAVFYFTSRKTIKKTLHIYEDQEKFLKKMEGKPKLVTESEIRLISEREPIKEVPVSDTNSGYM